MIKCDQEQSMKRIAELLQERRRPRRTIVEYSPKEPAWHHHRRTWRTSQTLQHESSGASTRSNRRIDKSMCQGVGNGLKTSLTKRNSHVNHVRRYNKTGQIMRLNKSCQVTSVCKWSKNRNNNMHQSQSPVHSHPVRVTKSQCKSARRRAVQEIPMTRMK